MNKIIPDISIIIPVFNVEGYIERCVKSLFEQTLDNLEYIFVNDCTPDNSMEILCRVMEQYPHRISQVKIFNHEINKGLASVRMTALKHATGMYIGCVDSDDWVETTMFEELLAAGRKYEADIVECDFIEIYPSHKVTKKRHSNDNMKDYVRAIIRGTIGGTVCNKIIKRNLFYENDIHAVEGTNMSEDMNICVKLLCCANRFHYVQKALYYYDLNSTTSITRTVLNTAHIYDGINNAQDVMDFFVLHHIAWITPEDIISFKFGAKKKLLFTDSIEDLKNWRNIYPEVNHEVYKSNDIMFRHKIVAWLCIKQWWFPLKIWIHFKAVYINLRRKR